MTAVGGWLLAVGGGLAWALCFARQPLVVAPWLALTPLLLLLGDRRSVRLAFAHGITFWLVSLSWIVATLQAYGDLPRWLAGLSLLALAAYLALFFAAFAAGGAVLWRRGGAPALFGLPALWVVLEWLRGELFTGFPWNSAALAWIEVPGALPLSAWVGALGVSYLVVLANTGIALTAAGRGARHGTWATGLCLVALAIGGRWAATSSGGAVPAESLPVRLLQPNTELLTQWDEEQVERDYRRIFALSRRACDQPGSLVIWPESAAWPYSFSRHPGLRRDLLTLAAAGCPLVVNTSMETGSEVFNSVLLITERGVEGRYDKRHLVPFGEYVPLAGWLPFLQKIARNAGDFVASERLSLLAWRDQRLGAAICFEVTFAEEVAEQVRAGATLLITVTNDAWYGDTWAPWQHFRAARFRAAENRRYLLRAALTGVSAVVRPDGSVADRLSVGEQGWLAARIVGRSELAPYSRVPWLVPTVCMVAVAFAIFLGRRGRRS